MTILYDFGETERKREKSRESARTSVHTPYRQGESSTNPEETGLSIEGFLSSPLEPRKGSKLDQNALEKRCRLSLIIKLVSWESDLDLVITVKQMHKLTADVLFFFAKLFVNSRNLAMNMCSVYYPFYSRTTIGCFPSLKKTNEKLISLSQFL